MNILFINTSDNSGGAARLAWDLGSELINKGHNVKYLVGRKIDSSTNSEQICKRIFPIISGKDFDLYIKQMFAFITANDIRSNPLSSNKIFNHKWYKEADIVHLHNLHGNYIRLDVLKRICREKKVIWTLHDMWALTGHCAHSFDCNHFQDGCKKCPYLSIYFPIFWDNASNLLKNKSKIYKSSVFHLVSPSKWLAAKVNTSILNEKRLTLIPNGINVNVFKPQDKLEIKKKLGISKERKVIVTVGQGGNNNQFKGGKYFNDVAKHNNDFLFISIGGEVGLNGNILGTGYISDLNLLSMYYSVADVFFFPSLAENCPLVVLEAMSCGIPVLAFNIGGIPELVEHKVNGYISEYKNLDDLNMGLSYLINLKNSELIKMRKANMRKVKTKYSLNIMVNKYIELYKSVLENKK